MAFVVPPEGDPISARIAHLQHVLVCRWRATGISGAAIARRWGVSRQTVSRTTLGERWAGETVLAALLASRAPRRDQSSPTRDREGSSGPPEELSILRPGRLSGSSRP